MMGKKSLALYGIYDTCGIAYKVCTRHIKILLNIDCNTREVKKSRVIVPSHIQDVGQVTKTESPSLLSSSLSKSHIDKAAGSSIHINLNPESNGATSHPI
jgi:hypothetical protein